MAQSCCASIGGVSPRGTGWYTPSASSSVTLTLSRSCTSRMRLLSARRSPRVEDGCEDLHAAVEIALHQVGAAHEDFFFAPVVKVVDAAVLQKAADEADDADRFAQSGHAGAE